MATSRTFRYLPLGVFAVVYVLSCLLGAVLILGNYRPFIALFEYFSGTHIPQLTSAQRTDDLVLLIAAPLVLAIAYVATTLLLDRRLPVRASRSEANPPEWLPHVVFYALAALGAVSLGHAGAFSHVHSWFNYGSWIHARSTNLARIGFAGFVNLYLLIPIAATWVVLSARPRSIAGNCARWLPSVIAVVLSLLLYMRKAALVVVLILAFGWIIHLLHQRTRGFGRWLAVVITVLVIVYGALVIVPVYSDASHAVAQASHPSTGQGTVVTNKQLARLNAEINFKSRREAIVIYSIVSPLTRSSAPALYYPVVFPNHHKYFGLDVGQDVLGIGAMPDDNIVVWNYLNPNLPGGTEMVPYQFVLFSQVGVLAAVLLSLVVGAILAVAWRLTQSGRIRDPWSSLLGALVLLWAVYIAIDSVRNSTIVSYGVIWGLLFVAGVAGLAKLASLQPGLSRRTVDSRS